MQNEDVVLKLDLSVETLALLGQSQPEGPLGEDTLRCGSGSTCTPPTCCP
jgi:hypothetical protein